MGFVRIRTETWEDLETELVKYSLAAAVSGQEIARLEGVVSSLENDLAEAVEEGQRAEAKVERLEEKLEALEERAGRAEFLGMLLPNIEARHYLGTDVDVFRQILTKFLQDRSHLAPFTREFSKE